MTILKNASCWLVVLAFLIVGTAVAFTKVYRGASLPSASSKVKDRVAKTSVDSPLTSEERVLWQRIDMGRSSTLIRLHIGSPSSS